MNTWGGRKERRLSFLPRCLPTHSVSSTDQIARGPRCGPPIGEWADSLLGVSVWQPRTRAAGASSAVPRGDVQADLADEIKRGRSAAGA